MRPIPGVRVPAVAGQFYTADPEELAAEVSRYVASDGAREPAVAAVVPHAGYVYSGRVAGRVFSRIDVPARVVVLAVNHWGLGRPVATWSTGAWDTPLGRVGIDQDLVAAIERHAPFAAHDPRAHAREHSLEVQVPFLQVLVGGSLRIAPVSVGTHDLATLTDLGHAVASAVREAGDPVLVVASTDMTHYEDAETARRKDERAIERILALDGPGLLGVVLDGGISMCGVGPTTAALVAARDLGAREAELVQYANSGDVTGDDTSVVGYAGIVVR